MVHYISVYKKASSFGNRSMKSLLLILNWIVPFLSCSFLNDSQLINCSMAFFSILGEKNCHVYVIQFDSFSFLVKISSLFFSFLLNQCSRCNSESNYTNIISGQFWDMTWKLLWPRSMATESSKKWSIMEDQLASPIVGSGGQAIYMDWCWKESDQSSWGQMTSFGVWGLATQFD